ncbi:hypothetical protein KA119_02550 [Candidatus Gracilibacteria bacterium]|nr:hypothetical protein [Candidatus Gracilibacteria bacterium]
MTTIKGIETRCAINNDGITPDLLIAALDFSKWRTVDEIIQRMGLPEGSKETLEVVMRVRRLLGGLKLLGLVEGWSINDMDTADIVMYTKDDPFRDVQLRICRKLVDFDFLYRLERSFDRKIPLGESIVLDASTF